MMIKADWTNLPTDLWSIIGYKLDVGADRILFRSVCSPFRYSLPFPKPPWLVLPEPNEPQPDFEEEEEDDGLDYEEEVEDQDEEEEVGVGTSACNGGEVDRNQPPPRRFVSLGDQHVYELDLPEAHGKQFAGSTGTWLITVDTDGFVCLLNPFSRVQFHLPSQTTLIDYEYHRKHRDPWDISMLKVILSSPSARDCIAMAIHHRYRKLAIARPGDASWTAVETAFEHFFDDVIYYKGQFYAVNCAGVVLVYDIGDDLHPPKSSILMGRIELPKYNSCIGKKFYLVEWMGNLVMVIKLVDCKELHEYLNSNMSVQSLKQLNRYEETPLYTTKEFKVYKLDFTNRKWNELNNLGQYSLFLGFSTSIAVLTSDCNSNIKKNSIYFTDDVWFGYGISGTPGGHDMGVFDMETNNIRPHYKGNSTSRYSPPLWLIPSPLPKVYNCSDH